jgi:hypothetical protein
MSAAARRGRPASHAPAWRRTGHARRACWASAAGARSRCPSRLRPSSQNRGAGKSGWPRCPSGHTVPAAAVARSASFTDPGAAPALPRPWRCAGGSMYRWFSRSTCDRRLSTTKPTRCPSSTMCQVCVRRQSLRPGVARTLLRRSGRSAPGFRAWRAGAAPAAAQSPPRCAPTQRQPGAQPVLQPWAWRMCSSTSLALTGIGVPGP